MLSAKRILFVLLLLLAIKKKLLPWLRSHKVVIQHKIRAPVGLAAVEEAFRRNFTEGRETSSQLTCTVDGNVVLDMQVSQMWYFD
jgi:hypothetical protein